MMKRTRRWRLLSVVAVLALVVAACGGDDTAETTTTEAPATTTTEAEMDEGADLMAMNVGPACTAVPADGCLLYTSPSPRD